MKSVLVRFVIIVLFAAVVVADEPPHYSAWSTPVNLGPIVNSTGGDFFAAVSKDGLSLYFTAVTCLPAPFAGCRPGFGGWDIFISHRATTSDPWEAPENLGPTINTEYNESAPILSTDGHWMYFASNRPGGFGGNDLYVSRRHDKRDDFGWQAPVNLGDGVNTAANEAGPAVFEDDATAVTTLLFDSNRLGGPGPFTDDAAHNGNDIYVATRRSDGTFGGATLVSELSTPFADRRPAIRRDGLELFFASDRPGGVGGLDLWTATRVTTNDAWSEPVNVDMANLTLGSSDAVNVANQDAGPALSFDGTTLYFQSVRAGGAGAYDLFVTTRQSHPKTR